MEVTQWDDFVKCKCGAFVEKNEEHVCQSSDAERIRKEAEEYFNRLIETLAGESGYEEKLAAFETVSTYARRRSDLFMRAISRKYRVEDVVRRALDVRRSRIDAMKEARYKEYHDMRKVGVPLETRRRVVDFSAHDAELARIEKMRHLVPLSWKEALREGDEYIIMRIGVLRFAVLFIDCFFPEREKRKEK